MAFIGAIWPLLQEEIIQAVYGVTLNVKGTDPFEVLETDEESAIAFEEITGRPRLFQVGEPELQETINGGKAVATKKYHAKIKIHYPAGDGWITAAADDYEQIARALDDNSGGSVSGVQFRIVDRHNQNFEIPELEEEQNWRTVEVPLLVQVNEGTAGGGDT